MKEEELEAELQQILFEIDKHPDQRLAILQKWCAQGQSRLKLLFYSIAVPRTQMNSDPKSISINISGSVGNFNLGQQLGDIQAAATQLRQGNDNQIEFANALEALSSKAAADQSLPAESKQEVIESLKEISEHASANGSKLTAGIRAMLSRLPVLLAVAENGTQLWHQYGPFITKFFGL